MSKITFSQAIKDAMSTKMRQDKNVLLFGEDVGPFGGCFGVSQGMHDEFGEMRIRDTPISEGAILGCAIGSAATGLRPIAELMFMDFMTVGMDMLVNQAAKLRYMFGGKINLPMVVRVPCGAGFQGAAQHSQCLEAWITHVPGLKVVYPTTAADAYGLMLTSIADDNPVVFIEHKGLYPKKGEVDENSAPIPLGVADIKKEGKDVTIVATGRMVDEALSAAQKLSGEGIDAEVIDPRTLFPFDKDTIFNSVKKTNRAVVVTEEAKRGGFGGEISALISEEIFDYLDAPVVRIGNYNVPIPFSPKLESYILPNSDKIAAAVKKTL
ncbi:alpha-ketoacid dehydrogenase subunit beta [Clostridium luticellarii]|jgi:pyruvate dehydrogenase E1 component beta subunit|uniref:alpha-ketoacid dehydrogenase subunit beta n=1 Tax=Clostridium luticellarii TaxID=1691940 RepID=UPI002357005D|nr:alpha-ketoacid dehydrogenase subunit beta [Clostridium luticellarii]MCI1945088.1 alpha-ketoacid dehydrogenase subunit beta [Clostridium luticellarii]MCI1968581.1 alpha-ketoacid dehydrogenase subunit beta [Clostridium luticellarii]MCI1995885.1 alpha-ketoacid dehydrogenase subunit beta [Clostridium luticellarii]MCI2040955.1 alpha-ketoacid dehydrogenase subunit beta [Clostridium luticellarii]